MTFFISKRIKMIKFKLPIVKFRCVERNVDILLFSTYSHKERKQII